MLFNSYVFILVFLPITWAIYFFLNSKSFFRVSQIALIVASLVFYGFYNWTYLLIMLGSILLNYFFAFVAYRLKRNRVKIFWIEVGRIIIFVGILVNIGVLFYFKYMNFFLENINIIFERSFELKNIVLPLGISFYTFQQISFLVDTYKENIIYDFCDYAEFVCFFPQLVAGPIVSHDLIGQFRDKDRRKINYDSVARGLFLFAVGLLKKIIIADTFAKAVDWGFSNIAIMSSMDALIIMLSYTFQIYFDFSGYSDMAVGLASMFNIDIPCNFNAPYQADSIIEFWKRWHITLTNFLTKYVYYPLGGSRKGKIRTYFNIFVVFLVSGIWHGANWTFIVWGMIHGIANICNRVFSKTWNKIWIGIRWGCTFLFLCFTWTIFRADTLKQAGDLMLKLYSDCTFHVTHELASCFVLPEIDLLSWWLGIHGLDATNYIIMVLAVMGALILVLKMKPFVKRRFKPCIYNLIGATICLIWSVLSLAENSTFIYFGF